MIRPAKNVSRRQMLKWMGIGATATALAACAPAARPAETPKEAPKEAAATAAPEAEATSTTAVVAEATPVPTAPPRIYGKGTTEIVVWYQDWDGANKIMNSITPAFIDKNPNITVNLQAIGYTELFNKTFPSIAAGTEGDVLNLYTDWLVATDVTKVLLDVTEPAGGAAALEEKMWPSAFTALDTPTGKVFYFPWLAGIRGAVTTVNKDHLAEKKIDYTSFKTFEDLTQAAVDITQSDGGKLKRSGYSPHSSQYQLRWSFIWQLGGKFFDRTSGKWSHDTAEGEQAAQVIYDLYWKQKTSDFELFTNEYEAVSQNLVSMWSDGAWTAGVQQTVAKIPTDNIVTPFLNGAKEKVLYPQHMAIWGLSRKLVDSNDKLKASVDYAQALVSADALVQAFDDYSGVCMSKGVYQDPRIEKVKFGPMSKRIAEAMWPLSRYPGDHVANQGPAGTELDRAMRKEISIKEALVNMDTYLQ
jgi:ABC-type glycerol-3-phosphate transport system substrate-binding protein